MFFIPAYPFWALTIVAVDVVALYGLCAYGSRASRPGRPSAGRRVARGVGVHRRRLPVTVQLPHPAVQARWLAASTSVISCPASPVSRVTCSASGGAGCRAPAGR